MTEQRKKCHRHTLQQFLQNQKQTSNAFRQHNDVLSSVHFSALNYLVMNWHPGMRI